MASKREMTFLADRKRELIARSEVYRQTLALQTKELQTSFSWIHRTSNLLRSLAPAAAIAGPIIGLFFARKKVAPAVFARTPVSKPKKGLFAMALMGFQLYNRVRPFLSAFTQRREHQQGERRPTRVSR